VNADAAAIYLLVKRPTPDAVPGAVSALIAGICIVDASAIGLSGGSAGLVIGCAAGYLVTRGFQKIEPGT
jgi:hypothetical protein